MAPIHPPDPTTLGLAAAVVAAVLWAGATVLYGRAGRAIAPATLNAAKGVAVSALFAATLHARGVAWVGPVRDADAWRLWVLAGSGVVGITLGDTFYFAALNRLGPRRTALLSLLATPAVVLLGAPLLGEWPRPTVLGGIAVTVGGVAWVVAERRVKTGAEASPDFGRGVAFGLLAAGGQAVGAVMNRAAVDGGGLTPLTAALFRLGTATLALLPLVLLLAFLAPRRRGGGPRLTAGVLAAAAAAALLGTYGGIWLQQVAFANAPAGPVQTLLSTTPVWILPLAAMSGERVSFRAAAGAVVAVGGVAIVVLA